MQEKCSGCGTEIVENECVACEGGYICQECAKKLRILFPKVLTWQKEIDRAGRGDVDVEERAIWLDPLAEASSDEIPEMIKRADEERNARRQHYGADNRAVFIVDDNHKRMKYPGESDKVLGEYVIMGRVVLGDISGNGEIAVSRRNKVYTKTIKRVELTTGVILTKTDSIDEGNYGAIVVQEDTPFIYPGDTLIIR